MLWKKIIGATGALSVATVAAAAFAAPASAAAGDVVASAPWAVSYPVLADGHDITNDHDGNDGHDDKKDDKKDDRRDDKKDDEKPEELPVTGSSAAIAAGGAAGLLALGSLLYVLARPHRISFTA